MEQTVKILITLLYFVLLFGIGIVASRRIKDLKDFFVAGKQLGFWVVAFSARATGESAWLLLGLTGLGALIGIKAMWVVFGEILGVAVAWLILSRRFKLLTDRYDSITVPDYLESRLRDTSHLIRIIGAIALVVFPTIYVSAQLDATGKAFESFLGWDYYWGILVGFCVVLAYIVCGGFVAVAWSDLVQGILMVAGLVVLPIVALVHLGGFGAMWEGAAKLPGGLTSIWGAEGITAANIMGILALLLIGLGYLGSPQIFVRFISLRNEREIEKGAVIALLWTLCAGVGAVLIGMAGRVIYDTKGLTGDALIGLLGPGCEKVLPMLSGDLFPLVIAGLYVAIVLAAIMSTLDSLLLLASSALVRDFYQKILRPETSDAQMTKLCRRYTAVLSVLALGIALSVASISPTRTIFWFVIFGWSGIAATFCPVIVLSLFWKGLTRAGVAAGMVSGFFGVIVFKFWPAWVRGLGVTSLPSWLESFQKLEELAPAFFVSLFVTLVVSMFTQPPKEAAEDLHAVSGKKG